MEPYRGRAGISARAAARGCPELRTAENALSAALAELQPGSVALVSWRGEPPVAAYIWVMTFNVTAGSYDQFMGRFSGPLAVQFARLAGVRAGQRVLDAGPGALTAQLAERLGAGAVSASGRPVPMSPSWTRRAGKSCGTGARSSCRRRRSRSQCQPGACGLAPDRS